MNQPSLDSITVEYYPNFYGNEILVNTNSEKSDAIFISSDKESVRPLPFLEVIKPTVKRYLESTNQDVKNKIKENFKYYKIIVDINKWANIDGSLFGGNSEFNTSISKLIEEIKSTQKTHYKNIEVFAEPEKKGIKHLIDNFLNLTH